MGFFEYLKSIGYVLFDRSKKLSVRLQALAILLAILAVAVALIMVAAHFLSVAGPFLLLAILLFADSIETFYQGRKAKKVAQTQAAQEVGQVVWNNLANKVVSPACKAAGLTECFSEAMYYGGPFSHGAGYYFAVSSSEVTEGNTKALLHRGVASRLAGKVGVAIGPVYREWVEVTDTYVYIRPVPEVETVFSQIC